jgi:hypothetical protein
MRYLTKVKKPSTAMRDRLALILSIGIFLIGIVHPSESAVGSQPASKDAASLDASLIHISKGASEAVVKINGDQTLHYLTAFWIFRAEPKALRYFVSKIVNLTWSEYESSQIIMTSGAQRSYSDDIRYVLDKYPTFSDCCLGIAGIDQLIKDVIAFSDNVAQYDPRRMAGNEFIAGERESCACQSGLSPCNTRLQSS